MNREAQLGTLMTQWKDDIGINFYFNADGIVDPDVWDKQDAGKKILFILKDTNDLQESSLIEWLLDAKAPAKYGGLWPRVAEWWHAIQCNTANYCSYTAEKAQPILKKVAIMNLKKTPGGSHAEADDVMQHIKDYWKYIAKEIDLIDPDIIVFCGTWWMIEKVHNEYRNMISPETHFTNAIFPESSKKARLLIDFCHPTARYPAIMMYYGIQGIYRAAMEGA